jgi:hypothetical protein
MKVLENFIRSLEVGQESAFNRLVIKPLSIETDFKLPFLTLEEALEREVLEITEKSEGGSVPELLVKNRGGLDVIVLEGEELRGAKQNRIVNTTIIIPAGSEIILPVSCVEQGRWRYVSNNFSAGESVLYPSLRQKSHRWVTRSLRVGNFHTSDQGGIWSDISEKSVRLSVPSETQAMSDILETTLTPETENSLFEEIKYQEKQIGFLAFIGGGFAGGDLFGSADLCQKQLQKLMRGYYLDSLDGGVKFPEMKVGEIMNQIAFARHEQFTGIGKGTEMRFEGDKIQGAWKLVDENISHLSVFPRG